MIGFHYQADFELEREKGYSQWIAKIVEGEGRSYSFIDFIFCTDDYLLEMNSKYLGHQAYTDIITFDYSEDGILSGDVFISVDRVMENAAALNLPYEEELLRVMVHGVLHLMGYKDKEPGDIALMREKEDEKIKMFHVER